MMSTPILSISNLTLATQSSTIVSDLSFEIAHGEIVALTGKSGSGKTSVATAILNLLPAGVQFISGQIQWHGNETLMLPADKDRWAALRGRHIGFTQQDVFGAFNPTIKMGNQMEAIVEERAIRKIEHILHELHIKMEEVGLHDIPRLLNSFPHELSGGQLQRCQIAMVIVIRPELLIVDEPTSAVDKINQKELLHVFRMIRKNYNISILCITHEEDVVRQIADREIRLDQSTSAPESQLKAAFPQVNSIKDQEVILETIDLVYAHAFGGMMYKQGATIGEINVCIYRGKTLGIVGESGSGKSTFAQLLVGIFDPQSGKIILEGQNIDFQKVKDVHRLRSKVQLVMQDGRGSLHPHLTIREILSEVGIRRMKSDKGYILDLKASMDEVGLSESLLDRIQSQLSGGECLRVSIARALLVNPKILICDESTTSLDRATSNGILTLLSQLKKEKGLALIFISHDQEVIRQMADDIVVLSEGKVVEMGVADDILNRPTHPVTKRIFALHATSSD